MANFNKDVLPPTEIVSTTVPAGLNLVGLTLADRYYVQRKLGAGGIGDVYLARDKPELMARQVVVKVLQEKALNNEWIVTKFRQEIEALTRIDDPGVVGLLDAGTLPDGHPFLVMQFVEGENLRALMRPEGGMDLEDVAHIMQQAGSTLSAAHANDVIHRDLKPENIMARRRAERWQVKVIDFGIAKVRYSLIAPSTQTGHIAGTAYYMAPEQLEGKTVTPASDVYALGIIAYEMITGRRPFNPETPYQLIKLQQAGVQVGPRALRPALSFGAERAILKALSLEPENRYQSATEFTSELAKALLDEQRRIESLPDEETKPRSLTNTVPLNNQAGPVIEPVNPVPSGRRKTGFVLLAVAVVFVLGLGGLAWKYLPVFMAPERSLTYWLTVQRMYNDKPLGQPFQATGRDYFHTGDRFSLSIAATEPGALYLINHGRNENGSVEWNILFPTKLNNAGVAKLSPQQTVKTGDYRFVGSTGVETIWVIWTTQPNPLLDSIIRDALADGVIKTPASLQEFIQQHQSSSVEINYDEANSRALLTGRGEILVRRVELSHKQN